MLNINEKFLIGEKLLKIEVDKDHRQHLLRLTTDKNAYVFITIGDCCSETWFADINGASLVIDKAITEVKELGIYNIDKLHDEIKEEMSFYNVDDGRGRQEYDQAYSLIINTTGGTLNIIYRNSSNGYYGGEIFLLDDEQDGYYKYEIEDFKDNNNIDNIEWEEIKDDWQATGNG